MKGFVASFERIWEHTKHKGCGSCSLWWSYNKVKFQVFFIKLPDKFSFLVHPGAVNISAQSFWRLF